MFPFSFPSTEKPAFSGHWRRDTCYFGTLLLGMDWFSTVNALWSGDTCPTQTGDRHIKKLKKTLSITWHEGTDWKLCIPTQYWFLLPWCRFYWFSVKLTVWFSRTGTCGIRSNVWALICFSTPEYSWINNTDCWICRTFSVFAQCFWPIVTTA